MIIWTRITKHVFVFGYSNGGQMVFRLAIETPDEVADVAALGANVPDADSSSCAQQGGTARVMLANGTLDPINPYEGGKVTIFGFGYRGTALSSRASADQFAERNGITTGPTATQLVSNARLIRAFSHMCGQVETEVKY